MNQSYNYDSFVMHVRILVNGIVFESICGMTLSAAEDLIKEYKRTHPNLNCYIVHKENKELIK